MSSTSSSLARSLHPVLLPIVEECQRNGRINGTIAVTGIKSSILNGCTDGICDRFILSVPYCGAYLKWEMIFDHLHPSHPPDIIFPPEDEAFIPEIDKLLSFMEWDVTDTECLARLIEELLVEYRKYQFSVLASHQRLEFQYTTLKESYGGQQIDVLCVSDKNETTTKFYITLDVDFSTVPACLRKDNPGNYYAALSVTFRSLKATKVDSSLFLSSGLERVLGGKDCIKLPKWNNDTYLMEYVPLVVKMLQEKVNFLLESFIKRKEYLASILNVLGHSVLEYDTDGYKMISLLFEHQGFCFVTQIKFSDIFPKETPVLSLFSIYHKIDGQPLQVNVNSVPFNSLSEADENIKKMMSHLLHMVPQFKDMCKSKGTFL